MTALGSKRIDIDYTNTPNNIPVNELTKTQIKSNNVYSILLKEALDRLQINSSDIFICIDITNIFYILYNGIRDNTISDKTRVTATSIIIECVLVIISDNLYDKDNGGLEDHNYLIDMLLPTVEYELDIISDETRMYYSILHSNLDILYNTFTDLLRIVLHTIKNNFYGHILPYQWNISNDNNGTTTLVLVTTTKRVELRL